MKNCNASYIILLQHIDSYNWVRWVKNTYRVPHRLNRIYETTAVITSFLWNQLKNDCIIRNYVITSLLVFGLEQYAYIEHSIEISSVCKMVSEWDPKRHLSYLTFLPPYADSIPLVLARGVHISRSLVTTSSPFFSCRSIRMLSSSSGSETSESESLIIRFALDRLAS